MNAFIIQRKNQTGEMAKVTEALAARGVNILVSALPLGERWAIGLVTSDEQGARSALRDAGIAYQEVPVLPVRMLDKPGQAASVSRKLADAGINIELWLPVDTTPEKFIVAVGVHDIEAARRVLRDQVIAWSYR